MTEFPDLNARWLLIGSGEMVASKKDRVKELFDKEDFILEKEIEKKTSKAVIGAGLDEIQDTEAKHDRTLKTMEKSIDKIVIFYNDRTFSEYQPE